MLEVPIYFLYDDIKMEYKEKLTKVNTVLNEDKHSTDEDKKQF
jgi:hypothetical protein